MRFLLLLLVVSPAFALNVSTGQALIYVDLLQPLDPDARRGESADDFEAAKRIVQSDLERFLTASEEELDEATERLRNSLEILGDIGGYTGYPGEISGKRSLEMYNELWKLVAEISEQEFEYVIPAGVIEEDPVPALEVPEPTVEIEILPDPWWVRAWDYVRSFF